MCIAYVLYNISILHIFCLSVIMIIMKMILNSSRSKKVSLFFFLIEFFSFRLCFILEKLNVKFIDRNKDSGLPSEQELKLLKEAQERNQTLLRIPRRWRTILFISIIVYGNGTHSIYIPPTPIVFNLLNVPQHLNFNLVNLLFLI